MAHYLVQARPVTGTLDELRRRLDDGEIRALQPFGKALHHSLLHARRGRDGRVVWEEVDFCRPPLKMERAAVLDEFFTDVSVQTVSKGDGWKRIESLPRLWEESH